MAVCLRMVIVFHPAFFVNSFAHTLEEDRTIAPIRRAITGSAPC